jgi:hypothetical protein
MTETAGQKVIDGFVCTDEDTDDRWTIAFRNPRANRFRRVDDVAVCWHRAHEIAGRVARAHPELQVFYTVTAAAEAAGDVVPEDRGNLLVDSGRRVRVVEGAKLADLLPEPTTEPTTEPTEPANDAANTQFPECAECGARPGQAHDPLCRTDFAARILALVEGHEHEMRLQRMRAEVADRKARESGEVPCIHRCMRGQHCGGCGCAGCGFKSDVR